MLIISKKCVVSIEDAKKLAFDLWKKKYADIDVRNIFLQESDVILQKKAKE